MNKILIVDSSASDCRIISGLLLRAGYDPVCADSIEIGKSKASKLPLGTVIVTAMRLKDATAIELIDWIKTVGLHHQVVVILDTFSATDIYEVMRGHGAVDIIQRPALDKMLIETVRLYAHDNILFSSPHKTIFPRQSKRYQSLINCINKVAQTNLNILISGESGVGKEPVAEEIYRRSSRSHQPCVIFNASVLHHQYPDSKTLYNSLKQRLKKIAGGTIIIDNVQLIDIDIQNIISDIIKTEQYDIRFISLTDTKYESGAGLGSLGSFLCDRLTQYVINVPPLRECQEDIILLANFFLERYNHEYSLEISGFEDKAVEKLLGYPWPGNLRELKRAVRIAAIEAMGNVITAKELNFDNPATGPPPRFTLRDDGDEKARIVAALEYTNGHRQQTANLLGISRNTLQNKIRKYGIIANFS